MPLLNIKPCSSVPKIKMCENQKIFDIYNLCKSVIICGQKELRPQMVFIDHRLTQIGTD